MSARRKRVFETRPTGSEIQQTQRRPVKAAALRVHPLRVTAAELARRKFLHLAAGAAALPAMSQSVEAQTYPTRPITMVVPFPAGGTTDAIARVVAERMRTTLGQPVIIENVSGAAGSIGTGRVASARPDGYTIDLASNSTHVLNGALYSLRYDVLNDFAAISLLASTPIVLFARKTMPAKNLDELIVWLKSNPMTASAGFGSASAHLVTAYFRKQTGTNFTMVPYRGMAPGVQDVVAKQIDLFFGAADALPLVRAGSIKAYAMTGDTRLPQAPDVPTFAQTGWPALLYEAWYGLYAPKGTPKEIIDRLNAAAVQALAEPAVQSRLANLGFQVFPPERQTPEALGALVKADAEKWWPLIKEFGIKAE